MVPVVALNRLDPFRRTGKRGRLEGGRSSKPKFRIILFSKLAGFVSLFKSALWNIVYAIWY